jgi:uncharacterized protein
MKRSSLAVVACLLFASISFAQQNPADAPASRADVERYLDVMNARSMMKNMMDTMTKQMHEMIHQQVKNQQDLPPDAEARMDKMTDDMLRDFPFEDILQVMIPVYQKHFTKGDIDGLVAFYSSPPGQKVLKELPAINAEALQAAMPIVQKMTAKTMQSV